MERPHHQPHAAVFENLCQIHYDIWPEVCKAVGVEGISPRRARHGLADYLHRTRGPQAVQKQLKHRNPIYSMQYGMIQREELREELKKRNG